MGDLGPSAVGLITDSTVPQCGKYGQLVLQQCRPTVRHIGVGGEAERGITDCRRRGVGLAAVGAEAVFPHQT